MTASEKSRPGDQDMHVDMSNGNHDTTTKVTGRAATQGGCPFRGTRIGGGIGSEPQIDYWWPERLKVELLHQNPTQANPLRDQDYAKAFAEIDYEQRKSEDFDEILSTARKYKRELSE